MTVGGANADIKGFNSEAIQTPIDALYKIGGGKVILLPGNYDIIAPVKLYSNMSLSGAGEKTVLKKCKGFHSLFALDPDHIFDVDFRLKKKVEFDFLLYK